MTTVIFSVIGAVAGAYIGGPGGAVRGAMYGWSIGTTIGSYVEQSQQHYYTSDMGKSSDLRVTVASYGTSIPQCWGKTRVPGVITWSTDLQEHEQDINNSGGGGSGGPTVTTRSYTYTVSFAMVLCKGGRMNSSSIQKIYADDLVVYDRTASPSSNKINPRFYIGSETQNADPLIIASAHNTNLAAGLDNPAFRGTCYMVVENMLLTDFGNRLPNFSVLLDTGQLYVSDVLQDVFSQVGIDPSDMDFSLVTGIPITGGVISSRIDAKSCVMPFLAAYNIDIVDVDGKIKAVPRGGTPIGTITFDDMGATTVGSGTAPAAQRITKSKQDVTALPKRIDLGYYSTSIDLQQATQAALRQSAPNDNYVSLSYPLSLGDDEARHIAERNLYLAWVERMSYQCSVLPKWANLSPADVVFVQVDADGTLQRSRILEAESGLLGEIKLRLVKDNDAILTQVVTGSTPTGGVNILNPIATTFFAWSGKELRDEDGISAGFYVVATGEDGWRGCTVLYSVDGGTSYVPIGSVSSRGRFGSVSNALGSTFTPNTNGFDTTNTLSVILNSPGQIISTDENSVLNGQGNYGLVLKNDTSVSNVSDYEILGFANVSFVSTSHYTISDLLRSRRTTPTTGHTNTDMFVQLDTSIQRITVSSNLVGQTVLVKCVSSGQDPSTVSPQTVYIASPTAPYASGADILAGKTPYFRVRGYLGGTKSTSLDATYFKDATGVAGANYPSGVTQDYWQESSLSPIDLAWKLDTPGTGWTLYLRANLKNNTSSIITFNYWIPVIDNHLEVVFGGSSIYSGTKPSGALVNQRGTMVVAAGATKLLELFYYNLPNDYNPAEPGAVAFITNALQSGLTWLDAGK